jgi:glycosyltransferase involved in cell wall biosynthesis
VHDVTRAPVVVYHHRTAAEDGQAVHIRAMLRAFAARGAVVHEIGLVRRGQAAPQPPASAGESRPASGFDWVSRVPRFARELLEYGYTAVARRRLIEAIHELRPDFVYERYAFGNLGGVAAARRTRTPLFLEVNSPLVDELARTRGLSFPRLARRVERDALRGADVVCAVTGVLADMLVELGAVRERILVTPNGVHLEQYGRSEPGAARQALGLSERDGAVWLGFVGYHRPWHRLDLVVAALARPALAHAQLVLVGEGPARAELDEAARRHGVAARVHHVGPRRHDEIPSLLAAFDVGLVPAINPYASPLKLHEYMAAGLPTVAPDQPNLREVLVHEREALLFAPGDGDALTAALVRLVEDGALRTRLGREARRQIDVQGLTWERNAERVLERAHTIGALR